MLQARMVTFWAEKDGSAPHEWEDGALGDIGDPQHGRNPRFVIADGATEAYDSIRWAEQLVTSFANRDGTAPELNPPSIERWLEAVQQAWVAAAPPQFANIFEEHKFAEGSFATLLGCELRDIDGPAPSWKAVALGDAVLFHVRQGGLLLHFPPLTHGDFGLNPDGVHTGPAALPTMMQRISFAEHEVQAGDRLFLATDALADWILHTRERAGEERLWNFLSRIGHPDTFCRFIADSRAGGAMKNDDVTLMRVLVTESDPDHVMVCL
jgi:hypothetical protein